jgi:Trk K+ transport system NAD-binding subunit
MSFSSCEWFCAAHPLAHPARQRPHHVRRRRDPRSRPAARQLSLAPGGRLDGQALADVLPHFEGVVLLGVAREDGTYLGAPPLSTVLLGGDTVTVYGRDEVLATLSGPEPR